MNIVRVEAFPLHVNLDIKLSKSHKTTLSTCYVEIETESGLIGHGLTAITEESPVASAINEVVAPNILGMDAFNTERIWDKLYWIMSPRGQTGYSMHAISAVDIALWDLKGKFLDQPIWKLLGGARKKVPAYCTFGFPMLDDEELTTTAKKISAQGFKHLKMVVGHHGLQRRDEPRDIEELIQKDIQRIKLVQEAVGPEVTLYVDANCSLLAPHAHKILANIRDCNIGYFEEPVSQNDALLMRDLRKHGVPLAAGQNEGLAFRFRELLTNNAVDYIQPNVINSGGFTGCVKIAGLATAFNTPLANGGAFPLHNMHLHGGLNNGGKVEWHLVAHELLKKLYVDVQEPIEGWFTLSDEPGLGLTPRFDEIRKLRINSQHAPAGSGKG